MANLKRFLRKIDNELSLPEINPEDIELENFFTDFEHVRSVFSSYIDPLNNKKRILIIHGVGGVGKSTLLRFFRLACNKQKIPNVLLSGEDIKSSIDVITGIQKGLSQHEIRFKELQNGLDHINTIHSKVNKKKEKVYKVAKGSTKVALEIATGYIPIVGPIISAIGGAGIDAFVDWLKGFLPSSELDLYTDPSVYLTESYLNDINKISKKKRIVLMFDTYERLTGLDPWIRNTVKLSSTNILYIIAGRSAISDEWDRDWPGWMSHAHIENVSVMNDDQIRELIYRYYSTIKSGKPDERIVDEIVCFSRGLPLVVTSSVRLWVNYGATDFRSIKPQVVSDLIDRILENIPAGLHPALEVAATLHWFNKDLLRELLDTDNIDDLYLELKNFPFIRSRTEGIALHDVVRTLLDENIKTHDSERYHLLHTRALDYFTEQLENAGGNQQGIIIELIYHTFCINEEKGIKLFCRVSEDYSKAYSIQSLKSIIDAVGEFSFENGNNKLWWKYYSARLLLLQNKLQDAKILLDEIIEDKSRVPLLESYVLCDLGEILHNWEDLSHSDTLEKSIHFQEKSLSLHPLDNHLVQNLFGLAWVNKHRGRWSEAQVYIEKAMEYFQKKNDSYGLIKTFKNKMGIHAQIGDWQSMFAAHIKGVELLNKMDENLWLKADFLGHHGYAWGYSGRIIEGESILLESLRIARDLEDQNLVNCRLRDLGLIYGLEGRYKDTNKCMIESLEISKKLEINHKYNELVTNELWGSILTIQGNFSEAEDQLYNCLSAYSKIDRFSNSTKILYLIGTLHEYKNNWTLAIEFYNRSLSTNKGQRYIKSLAHIGLIRSHFNLNQYNKLPSLEKNLEMVSNGIEYFDISAWLYLVKAYTAWFSPDTDWGTGFSTIQEYFQQSINYAIKHNKYLLDEIIFGRDKISPLVPIATMCFQEGEEGHQVLAGLRNWWKISKTKNNMRTMEDLSGNPKSIQLEKAEDISLYGNILSRLNNLLN